MSFYDSMNPPIADTDIPRTFVQSGLILCYYVILYCIQKSQAQYLLFQTHNLHVAIFGNIQQLQFYILLSRNTMIFVKRGYEGWRIHVSTVV